MAEERKAEDVYLESTHKLRTSLPKFVIFLGAAFLIWMFGSILLIPLGQGIYIANVETSKIVNLVVIASILVLISLSFREIRKIADACAGFVAYYAGNEKVKAIRLEKLQRAFRNLSYVIFVSILFLMFKSLLEQVHPALSGVTVIIIAIWAIVALYSVVMALSSEIEEAAKSFISKVEKRIRRKE